MVYQSFARETSATCCTTAGSAVQRYGTATRFVVTFDMVKFMSENALEANVVTDEMVQAASKVAHLAIRSA